MSADDLLYDQIKPPNSTRTVTEKINDCVEITYFVATTDGVETWTVVSISITSGSPSTMTVIVDSKIVAQPPYSDDYCLRPPNPVQNTWVSSNFGFITAGSQNGIGVAQYLTIERGDHIDGVPLSLSGVSERGAKLGIY